MPFKFASMRLSARSGLGAIAACALSACAEPLGPEAIPQPIILEEAISRSQATATTGIEGFEDITGRVLPSMNDQGLANDIKSKLMLLIAAVEVDDREGARNAVARTHQLLATAEIHPASLGAIRMALRATQSRIHPEVENQ